MNYTIYSMNKQRVKRAQMPSSLEHLRTFDTDRLRSVASVNMRKKPFCARFLRKTRGIRMVGAMRERPWRGAARSLFIHVCERETMNKQRVKRALLLPGVLHTAKRLCALLPAQSLTLCYSIFLSTFFRIKYPVGADIRIFTRYCPCFPRLPFVYAFLLCPLSADRC